jgi:CRP-like cAMP-binding protein
MGALELGDVRALTASVVYEIPKERFADIMRVRPTLAEDLASLLTARTMAEERLHDASRTPSAAASSSLSARIKHLFHLAE